MRLQDGQVMDFTKNVGPYVDERFGTTAAPAEAPVQAPLQSTIGSLTVQVDSNVPVLNENGQLNDEFVAAEMNAISHPDVVVSQWGSVPQNNYTIDPFSPPLGQRFPFSGWPSVGTGTQMPNDMNAIRAKVQARVDALTALEDQTPEMKATIKALTWVLEEITRNTVSFTNTIVNP